MSLPSGTHRIDDDAHADRVDRVLRGLLPGASWSSIRKLIDTGKLSVNGRTVLDPSTLVRGGDELTIRMSAPRPRLGAALPGDAILYADAQLVVVDKPAGISSVAFDESELDSLDQLVQRELERRDRRRSAPLGVVHRLDKETSGILVLARTLAAKRELKQQFRFHTSHRRYLAIVHGEVKAQTFHSRLVRDRGDGLRGSTKNPKLGRESTTHVRRLEGLAGATLIECTLETGRTHQIRIHLSEAGHPVVGDRVYIKGFTQKPISAARLMLHAAELGFTHPVSGQRLSFSRPPPADFRTLLATLRNHSPASSSSSGST